MNPDIFKAYDVRGLYPQEFDEATAGEIGRGFVTYLEAKRIAVSRDMRAVVAVAGRGLHRGRAARRAPTSSTTG